MAAAASTEGDWTVGEEAEDAQQPTALPAITTEDDAAAASISARHRTLSQDVLSKLLPPPPVSPKRTGSLLESRVCAVVCGDLGGTNSRLELFRIEDPSSVTAQQLEQVGKATPLFRNSYKNDKIDGDFTQVMHQFLEDSRLPRVELVAGCLAVAGPVANDRVTFTNLSWVIDSRHLEQEFFMPKNSMRLVNDFVANGYGVVTLGASEYEDISPRSGIQATRGAPVACVGAGTGLGETYATCSHCDDRAGSFARYDAWPSEGGHVGFAPRDSLQRGLLAHLSDKFGGRVSTERVVSGKGIVNVYEYLATQFPDDVDPKIDAKIRNETEGAALVSRSAYDNAVCAKTMDVVLDAYGAELGNAAVKWLPFGGLYIAGGIAGKNVERIRPSTSPFMLAYKDRGRVSNLLHKIPLRLVTVDDLGLRGAHYVALTVLIEQCDASALEKQTSLAAESAVEQKLVDDETAADTAVKTGADAAVAAAATLGGLETAVHALAKAVVYGSGTIAIALLATALLLANKRTAD